MRLLLFIGTEFQGLFHSPPGVLFTFPSRYSFTIDPTRCLALEGGPPSFKPDFTCPILLEKSSAAGMMAFRIRGFHPLRLAFPDHSPMHHTHRLTYRMSVRRSRNPHRATLRCLALCEFRLFPFRSSLLRESRLISFPRLLRYFNSASVHPFRIARICRAGFPHSGTSGYNASWQLPGAYRSLVRPSSDVWVKVSIPCRICIQRVRIATDGFPPSPTGMTPRRATVFHA